MGRHPRIWTSRPRHAGDRPVLGTPRDHARQLGPISQRPAGGHSFVVSLCRLRAPEDAAVIQRVLAMSGPRQPESPAAFLTKGEVDACWHSLTSRPGRAAGTMPCSPSPCRQGCGERADRGKSGRRPARERRGSAMHRQGPKGALHPSHHEHRRRRAGMDGPMSGSIDSGSAVPQQPRRPA